MARTKKAKTNTLKRLFLVDFENVKTDGLKDIKGVSENDSMIIFYSENCKNITLDVILLGSVDLT